MKPSTRSIWRRVIGILLGVLVGLYVVAIVGLFLVQRSLLFPAPRPHGTFPAGRQGFVRDEATGTLMLHRPGPVGAPTVVFFHGNGEDLANSQHFADALHARGLGFLGVEYPGYGFAGGEATESGLYDAGESALRWLHDRSSEPIALMGRSLGTGVAVELASRGHGERVVLVSPYTSIPDVAAGVFPYVPARWLVRDRFDSLRKAPSVHVPVLLVHGTADEVVPYAMGERLLRAFPAAELITERDAHHNDVLERSSTALDRVAAFLRGADRTHR